MIYRYSKEADAELEALNARIQPLVEENARLREALGVAVYDLERIRDANWDEHQMRLGARSGAHVARAALVDK